MITNPASISMMTVGREKSPVVIIDDYLSDPHKFRTGVWADHRFERANTFYPGVISGMNSSVSAVMIAALRIVLDQVFGLPRDCSLGWSGMYAIASIPPERLARRQTIPHADDISLFQVASVLYLFEEDMGGTAFYRQRRTGFERIIEDRRAVYEKCVDEECSARERMQPNYVGTMDRDYECVGSVPSKFNRMILYPSNLLHSGLVDQRAIARPLHQGRLTANLFIGRAA
jgi:hypothetical protein